ncbi:anti-sigma factor [Paracoccus sp. YIM 132242]|uniref:Anti-sigma factor n=1 Tax=Paracoccus lichenicola TaxID=2665644 RepID=A0A6L6HNV4_9RHOB|nr:anti-sigma factor [Paracoccus lichenicola]MTD99979.1 anti-sigma factor [Paracoccus lichenicola]
MSTVGIDLPDDSGGDDILAAEFVLGVLPADDHAALERRLDGDAGFARQVAAWQDRLLPLADGFAEGHPSPAVKRDLDIRLFGQAASGPRAGFWESLALWRGLAGIATAAFLFAVALPRLAPDPAADQARLVASLADQASDVHYVAVYDPGHGVVGLSHLSGNPAAGRAFELWVVQAGQAPVSLGVIPAGAAVHLTLDSPLRTLVGTGAQLAISLEPPGGSPTGLPTGAVVAAGDLRGI